MPNAPLATSTRTGIYALSPTVITADVPIASAEIDMMNPNYILYLLYVREPDYSGLSWLSVDVLSNGAVGWDYGWVRASTPGSLEGIQTDRSGYPATL